MWKKRDELQTVEEIIIRNTGQDIKSVLNPRNDSHIVNMDKAAVCVFDAISKKQPITIVGDYDVDGITGAAILYYTFKQLGTIADVRLPKRFTEGYGISTTMIEDIHSGLLITVDNGITAVEELALAKSKGLTVVILDHHIAREDGLLPEVDVLVNPHVLPSGGFGTFCGAGLAYKLASQLLEDKSQLEPLCALAALGTIADVVPLIDDNRYIVINGLRAINQGKAPQGLLALIEQLNLFDVDESDVSFTIAPILNAAGRMRDDGAQLSFSLLTAVKGYAGIAEHMIKINEKPKIAQTDGMNTAMEMITVDGLYGDPVMLLYSDSDDGYPAIPEGVAGILAGRLAERYQVPAFVLTQSDAPDILKGSGRSYGGIDIKSLLDQASDLLEGYGGHPKAAGLSVKKENIEALRTFLIQKLSDHPSSEESDTLFYDLEVDADELPELIENVQKFAPYGEGNNRLNILVTSQRLYPRQRRFFTLMGSDLQHVKLFCGNKFAAVGFDLAKKYSEYGEPMNLDIVGSVFVNKYTDPVGRRLKETQLRIEDFRKSKIIAFSSPLTTSVQEKLRALGGI
ncbi:MAG: DHH family phosphoesterase [Clostridiales bacterium]|jgi:single-stranded-DNA-specific exonuclease|nr:DHH family phosphoesterase [Clostridiales bacterium]